MIDVTNVVTLSRKKALAFFESATGNLLAAEQRAGVAHHVLLSIVGVDRVGLGYYMGKRRQEELALAGPVPVSVLRATQFHEFAEQMIERGGPLTIIPGMLSQPIAAREVAAALVEIARGAPQGLAPELAGPEQLQMTDMVRRVLQAQGRPRPVIGMRLPGATGKALVSGGLLPTSGGPLGRQTYSEWLADRVASDGSLRRSGTT